MESKKKKKKKFTNKENRPVVAIGRVDKMGEGKSRNF